MRHGDEGHHAPAESGDLSDQQPALLRIQAQIGAVGGEAGPQPHGQTPGQVPSVGSGAAQEDAGPPLHQGPERHRRVGLDREGLEEGMIRHPHLIRPPGEGLLHQGLHPMAEEQAGHPPADPIRQLPGLGEQLQGHPLQDGLFLL